MKAWTWCVSEKYMLVYDGVRQCATFCLESSFKSELAHAALLRTST